MNHGLKYHPGQEERLLQRRPVRGQIFGFDQTDHRESEVVPDEKRNAFISHTSR